MRFVVSVSDQIDTAECIECMKTIKCKQLAECRFMGRGWVGDPPLHQHHLSQL